MGTSFHSIRPTELNNYVQLYWQIGWANRKFNKETIIPKGSIEIIFNLTDRTIINATIGSRDYKVPGCFISGYHTVPIQMRIPYNLEFFGVVFNITAIKNIFKLKGVDFANQCLDMTLVDPGFYSLWHQLAEQKTFNERVTVFSTWLKKRIPETKRQDQRFDAFLNNPTNKITSVAELSKWMYYSPRQLSRKLQELTGMNSEQTLLYKKYLHGINLIHHSTLSLTEIAYACNFSDQSHFIKTFKSFARIRPNDYKNIKSHISGHIFENVLPN